jgi:hypothetical protein
LRNTPGPAERFSASRGDPDRGSSCPLALLSCEKVLVKPTAAGEALLRKESDGLSCAMGDLFLRISDGLAETGARTTRFGANGENPGACFAGAL